MVLREVGKGRGGENSESEALKVNDEKTQSERDYNGERIWSVEESVELAAQEQKKTKTGFSLLEVIFFSTLPSS